jgi:hypothetical protein
MQDVAVEAFFVDRAVPWVWSALFAEVLAGVVAVGYVMAAGLIHVFNIFFSLDVWIELAESLEGLLPSVKFPVDDEGNAGSKMTESVIVKFGVVNACCCNASSSIDDAVAFLGRCEVDV